MKEEKKKEDDDEKKNDGASQLILQEAYVKNDEVDVRAEQPKLDRGDDDRYERRRENGLSPELRGDRSVHALMKVSSSSSEMKSEYPEENVQKDVKKMTGVCASLYKK